MKLRNKKTGKIVDCAVYCNGTFYHSVNDVFEEWEDYEEPEKYWYIDFNGEVKEFELLGFEWQGWMKEIGNYFETKEEAEKAVEKLKAWKRLKNKGFRFAGWDMRNGDGGYEPSIGFELNGVTDVLEEDEISQEIAQDLEICFGGEE